MIYNNNNDNNATTTNNNNKICNIIYYSILLSLRFEYSINVGKYWTDKFPSHILIEV